MNMRRNTVKRTMILLLGIVLLLAACNANAPEDPTLEFEDAWARAALLPSDASAAAATSAIYMTIRNRGRTDDKLINASSDVAEIVELHTTETRNGVTMMSRVDQVEIPGLKKAELKPGGLHVMLIRLTQDLIPGDTVKVTLEFEKSGTVVVEAPVREP
jgi:copper(I)-binding protein